MNCGTAFAVADPSGGVGVAAPPPSRSKLIAIISGALLVVAVAFILGATGVLRIGAQRQSPTLQEQATPPEASITKAETPTPTGVTIGPPPEKVKMPDDIKAWLEHLRRCEEKRVALSRDQVSSMMVTLSMLQVGGADEAIKDLTNDDPNAPPPNPPTKKVVDQTVDMRTKWRELSDLFNSVPPPAECKPIRDDYDQALRETGGMMMDILGTLDNAGTNPQEAVAKLMQLQGKSADRIDEKAQKADDGVSAICDKYETPKWFKIVRDIGGGGLLNQFQGIPSIPGIK